MGKGCTYERKFAAQFPNRSFFLDYTYVTLLISEISTVTALFTTFIYWLSIFLSKQKTKKHFRPGGNELTTPCVRVICVDRYTKYAAVAISRMQIRNTESVSLSFLPPCRDTPFSTLFTVEMVIVSRRRQNQLFRKKKSSGII